MPAVPYGRPAWEGARATKGLTPPSEQGNGERGRDGGTTGSGGPKEGDEGKCDGRLEAARTQGRQRVKQRTKRKGMERGGRGRLRRGPVLGLAMP